MTNTSTIQDLDLIHSDGETMNHILLNSPIRMTLFTGSSKVAEKLAVDLRGKVCICPSFLPLFSERSTIFARSNSNAISPYSCHTFPKLTYTSFHCTILLFLFQIKLEDAGFDWKVFGPDVPTNEAEREYVAWTCDQDAYACSGQKCSAQVRKHSYLFSKLFSNTLCFYTCLYRLCDSLTPSYSFFSLSFSHTRIGWILDFSNVWKSSPSVVS